MADDIQKLVRIEIHDGHSRFGSRLLHGPARVPVGQEGVVLIALIVVLFLISSLVVAMMSQSISTAFSLAYENSSNRAYYLGESGFRYAVARINNGADMKTDLHLRTPFTLANNAGTIDLHVFPHYLESVGLVPSGSPLTADTPAGYDFGSTEVFDFPDSGKIKIIAPDGSIDAIYAYGSAIESASLDAGTGKYTASVNFLSLTPAIGVDLPSGTVVLPVATEGTGSDQNNIGGDDGAGGTVGLKFSNGSADAFPKYNGVFKIDGEKILYSYEEKDDTADELKRIKAPLETNFSPFTVAAGADIVLQKFIRLKSVGVFRNASRSLTFHMPLASDIEKKAEFAEKFEDKANWEDSSLGDHGIETIGGGKALRVTGTESLGASPKASLIAFKPSADALDIDAAYRYGDPYFLSYDAQVKIGFTDTDPDPDHGYFPAEPIPRYYVAGLSFRLDENLNSYGLSFLRGSNNTDPKPDNIDDDMVPDDQKTMVVLWQQTGNGTDPQWIAYKEMASSRTFFSDTVEKGVNGWTASGLWHISNRRPYGLSSNAWYYGRESDWDYDVGTNSGSLTSPPINLCHASNPILKFRSWYLTEASQTYDRKYIDIYDGVSWQNGVYQILTPNHPMLSYDNIEVDLSAYADKTIQVRFRFDTIDNILNDFEGWHVDNIVIEGEMDFPIVDSTLMVRVKEAASIQFDMGASAISQGDIVVGSSSGAYATVAESPHINAGSWIGGNAEGTLILRNVKGTFDDTTPENLTVVGTAVARVDAFHERANFIRAYYGDASGCGSPDGDLFDDQRGANERGGDTHWPPDAVSDWDAAHDHFTLIQWKRLNASVASAERVDSENEPDAIIRSDEGVLLSPDTGIFGKPELGLHTFGNGSLNVYFDDFAIQSNIIPDGGFLPAIQQ